MTKQLVAVSGEPHWVKARRASGCYNPVAIFLIFTLSVVYYVYFCQKGEMQQNKVSTHVIDAPCFVFLFIIIFFNLG